MDALTDVLESARVMTSISCVAEVEGAWSMYARPRPEGVFYLIVGGSAWLQIKGEAPCALKAGEVIFCRMATHTLSAIIPIHRQSRWKRWYNHKPTEGGV